MGIIQKIKQNMEEYAENHTPDEVQDMSPQQELMEDLRDPMFKSLAACLAVTGYILSGFGVGYIVVIFRYFTIDVDMLLILKYGFLSWWANLFNILFALICVGVAYKLFRATRKNYMLNKKRNFYVSKSNTFSNAHFQTQAEMEKVFNIYDSIEDAGGAEILFKDADNRVYELKTNQDGVYRANFNEIFYGTSGSGKSASIVKTHIYQAIRNGDSLYVTDSKGDLYTQTVNVALENGYKVKVLNTKAQEFRNSDGFNPLACIYPDNESNAELAALIADIILQSNDADAKTEDYWYSNKFNLLKCLILYVATDQREIDAGHNNIPYIYDILSKVDVADFRTMLLTGKTPDDPIVQCYNLFAKAPDKNQGMVVNDLGVSLQKFVGKSISQVLSNDEIDLELPMKRKCIYYAIISDTDKTFSSIVSLFFTLSFVKQCNLSDSYNREEKKKQLPVRYVLDEYANCGSGILGLDVRIATIRSRKIWLTLILQDSNQLQTMYGEERANTIINNCFVMGFLSTNDMNTAKYISEKLGNQTIMVKGTRMAEGTADVIRAHGETQNTYSENKRPLMTPEELMNGEFAQLEIIYIIQQMPPVRAYKCYAEFAGEAIHPLEKRGMELGERKASIHKPKWRKRMELNQAEAAEALRRFEEEGEEAAGFVEDVEITDEQIESQINEDEAVTHLTRKTRPQSRKIDLEDTEEDDSAEEEDNDVPDLSVFDSGFESDANEGLEGKRDYDNPSAPEEDVAESAPPEEEIKPKGARIAIIPPAEDIFTPKPVTNKLNFKKVSESNVKPKKPDAAAKPKKKKPSGEGSTGNAGIW